MRYLRVSPQKARLVLDLIKYRRVEDAMNTLAFTKKGVAPAIGKLLRSAVANAENNHDMSSDGLFVTRITVDGGPGGGFTKRLDPRAQGRANFKRKRLSHVTIAVGPQPPKNQPKQRSGAAIGLKTLTQRQAKAATSKPAATARRKKQPAAAAGAGA